MQLILFGFIRRVTGTKPILRNGRGCVYNKIKKVCIDSEEIKGSLMSQKYSQACGLSIGNGRWSIEVLGSHG